MQKLTILFDLDGTLVDSAPDLMNAHLRGILNQFSYRRISTTTIWFTTVSSFIVGIVHTIHTHNDSISHGCLGASMGK